MAEEDKDLEQEQEANTPPNPLEMDDEELLNMDPNEFAAKLQAEKTDEGDNEDEEEGEEPDEESEEKPEVPDQTFTDGDEDEDESDETSDIESKAEQAEEAEEEEPTPEKVESKSEIDYKSEYEKIMAPFNASGGEHQAKTAEEVIKLMQFGVDYHKKTSTLKQLKRIVQPLEDHKLLTPDNISLFIDLVAKKDQNALKKVIGDFGLDPMDIEIDDSSEYKPNTYTVDESRVELDDVLDSIRDSEHYNNILDIIGNKWDDKSKQAVAAKPSIMRDLNLHISQGIYDQVAKEVERQRVMGNIPGEVSDLEAYNTVGAYMAENGLFQGQNANAPLKNQEQPGKSTTVAKKKDNPKLNQRRKAAGTTKSMPSGQKAPQQNPLGMSDEDFLKQGL